MMNQIRFRWRDAVCVCGCSFEVESTRINTNWMSVVGHLKDDTLIQYYNMVCISKRSIQWVCCIHSILGGSESRAFRKFAETLKGNISQRIGFVVTSVPPSCLSPLSSTQHITSINFNRFDLYRSSRWWDEMWPHGARATSRTSGAYFHLTVRGIRIG